MPYQHILFVEGPDDRHALWHLLKRHNIAVCMFDAEEDELITDTVAIKSLGGYETLRKKLPTELRTSSELLCAGVVVDANTSLAARWQSLQDVFMNLGDTDMADILPNEGWVDTVRMDTGILTAGMWLMPNNQIPGALEEFAEQLVVSEDILWKYARRCIEQLPEQRFTEIQVSKAHLHTWLSWQKEPGKPIGQAITKGFINPNAEVAQHFVDWVRRLFEL